MSTQSSDTDELRGLFQKHVPEVASGLVSIKGVARESGRRIVVVVSSSDRTVCPIGSCVGRRGIRIKTIVSAFSGEKIDLVLWSESMCDFIRNLLAPATIGQVEFDTPAHRAKVSVSAESAAILNKDGGTRLRLASRLAGWDLQLMQT